MLFSITCSELGALPKHWILWHYMTSWTSGNIRIWLEHKTIGLLLFIIPSPGNDIYIDGHIHPPRPPSNGTYESELEPSDGLL